MKKKIEFLIILLCCCGLCTAQQVVSSGGYAVKTDVTVNWILGGSLSDIPAININNINQNKKEQLIESLLPIKVYPVPATDFVNIEITPADTGRLNVELYDNTGIKVLNKVIPYQPVFQLSISDYPSGIYFLRVTQPYVKDQLCKVEKIVKQ